MITTQSLSNISIMISLTSYLRWTFAAYDANYWTSDLSTIPALQIILIESDLLNTASLNLDICESLNIALSLPISRMWFNCSEIRRYLDYFEIPLERVLEQTRVIICSYYEADSKHSSHRFSVHLFKHPTVL